MRSVILRRIGGFLLVSAALAGPARGAEDPASLGARLLEKHRYGEAVAVLQPYVASAKPSPPGPALLTLGVASLRNAALHRALHRTAAAVQVDYLKKLSAERGRGGSALAALYLGEALLAAGKPGEAKGHLDRFLAGSGKGTPDREVAAVDLALCRHRMGEKEKAKSLWSGVDVKNPEVRAELAAARARAGAGDGSNASMGEEALAALKRSGRMPPMRTLKNVALACARAGQAERGVALLAGADLSAFSREEVLGKNKTIRFYDPYLLDDLATVYLAAGVAWLEKAASDPRVREAAEFHLGEALALAGDAGRSAKAIDAVLGASRMAQGSKDLAAARQAANRYAAGRKAEAVRDWDALSRRQPPDPDLLAEVVSACGRAGARCPEAMGRAVAIAETGEGKRFRSLRFALGRHYLDQREYARALAFLEAGRDKGRKNKIEQNAPELLAALAEAYYRTRKYSEAQEIYFEMGKPFPAVRPIQDALQGIYAREQRSPGDVRIL